MTPSCFGDAMLKTSPALSKIFCSRVLMSLFKSKDRLFRKSTSSRIPSNSIEASTLIKGISIELNRFSVFALDISILKC